MRRRGCRSAVVVKGKHEHPSEDSDNRHSAETRHTGHSRRIERAYGLLVRKYNVLNNHSGCYLVPDGQHQRSRIFSAKSTSPMRPSVLCS